VLKRDFLEPLGIDAATFASHIELAPERLAAMLEGRDSLDVDASIRFARALGVSAERIMQMQTRYDFAKLREAEHLRCVHEIGPPSRQSFPNDGFLSGNLGMTADAFGGGSLFFQERLAKQVASDAYAGMHALWNGDRLRIYEPSGTIIWTGPLLQNLDGKILVPFVRSAVSAVWFASGYPADLAIGAEHAAFFERMRDA
jgi:addiction module HigA family antidote